MRTVRTVSSGILAAFVLCGLVLLGSLIPASASGGTRAPMENTAATRALSSDHVDEYTGINNRGRSLVSVDAAPEEIDIAPVTASSTAQSSIEVLPWILGVLAVAVAAGGIRAYVRSPQRQTSRAERTPR
jgi:hypothetical protein